MTCLPDNSLSLTRSPEEPNVRDFDEEACVDFITFDLGTEIPIRMRYAEGIHIVRKRLIDHYGDEDYGKAIAVFNRLIEDDDLSSGLGGNLTPSKDGSNL
jgi:hypothetical protein